MSLWSTDPNHYPPKPLLVLLQTVTPIDHFQLSFLGLWRIEPLAVAIKQQRQRHAMPLSTQIITIISMSCWFT
jgi:hypothetical protein